MPNATDFKTVTRSATETKKLGAILGKLLSPKDVVALYGELGAGKTTFVKGVATGLGVTTEKQVSSPTFVLIHEYRAKWPIFHLDWYRLSTVEGSDELLAQECFENQKAVTLVEWPERGKNLLPKKRIEVRLSHKSEAERRVQISFRGEGGEVLKRRLKAFYENSGV